MLQEVIERRESQIREGFKRKKKKVDEGGGGVSRGHFPHFIFWFQMAEKSILDIEIFFMYRGGVPPWRSSLGFIDKY